MKKGQKTYITQDRSVRNTPNLKKTKNGDLVNQYGVRFTQSEKKALENAVNKVHYRRDKQLKEVGALPRMSGGKETGDTVDTLQKFGKTSDFIITKKSKSLQRFQSRYEYNRYMKYLDKINTDVQGYIDDRTRLYKANYMKALDNVFGKSARDVKMKIRMMKPEDFRRMVEQDELREIQYIYMESDVEQNDRLNLIRESFGMKLKDPDEEDEE